MKKEYKQIIDKMYSQEEMEIQSSSINWSKTNMSLIFSALMITFALVFPNIVTADMQTETNNTILQISTVIFIFVGISTLLFSLINISLSLAQGKMRFRDMHYKEIHNLFYNDGFLSDNTYCLKFIKNSQECLDFGDAIKYNNDDEEIQIHFNNTNITEDLKKCKNVIEQLEYMNSLVIKL